MLPPLFLEATQLKTERTVIAVLRADPTEAEVQEVGSDACYCRRPAVSAGADGIQFSRTVFSRSIPAVAEARGRAVLSIPGGNATENRAHGYR
jgi:hypothetical protein